MPDVLDQRLTITAPATGELKDRLILRDGNVGLLATRSTEDAQLENWPKRSG